MSSGEGKPEMGVAAPRQMANYLEKLQSLPGQTQGGFINGDCWLSESC